MRSRVVPNKDSPFKISFSLTNQQFFSEKNTERENRDFSLELKYRFGKKGEKKGGEILRELVEKEKKENKIGDVCAASERS